MDGYKMVTVEYFLQINGRILQITLELRKTCKSANEKKMVKR